VPTGGGAKRLANATETQPDNGTPGSAANNPRKGVLISGYLSWSSRLQVDNDPRDRQLFCRSRSAPENRRLPFFFLYFNI
jgi:hypothetical protein